MSPPAEKLRMELKNLSDTERAELAHFLINSLHKGSDADADKGWDSELAQRLKQVESGQETGEAAEKVFAELRKKHS
jgi:putative addiction module component (TIGR02574 family)